MHFRPDARASCDCFVAANKSLSLLDCIEILSNQPRVLGCASVGVTYTMLEIINAKGKKLSDADFRSLAEIEEHTAVAKWDVAAFGGDVEKAVAGFKKSVGELEKRNDEFLVAKVDGKIVGFVGIHRLEGEIGEMKHVGEVRIAVHPHFQGKQIGAALLESAVGIAHKQHFERLEADTRAGNSMMRAILEKTGFRLEGVRKKRFKVKGEYLDEACYALLL